MKYLILLIIFSLNCKKNTESKINFAIFNDKNQLRSVNNKNNYIKEVSEQAKVEYCFLRYTNDLNEESKKRLEIIEKIFVQHIEDSIVTITGALVDFNVKYWTKELTKQYETNTQTSDMKKTILKHPYWNKSKSPIIPVLNQKCIENRNTLEIFDTGYKNIISIIVYFKDEINDKTIKDLTSQMGQNFTRNTLMLRGGGLAISQHLSILLIVKEYDLKVYKEVIMHELAHLFGIADTYGEVKGYHETISSPNDTANQQPQNAIMASAFTRDRLRLTTDDKHALWYSLYLANNIEINQCPMPYKKKTILNKIGKTDIINCVLDEVVE